MAGTKTFADHSLHVQQENTLAVFQWLESVNDSAQDVELFNSIKHRNIITAGVRKIVSRMRGSGDE